MFGGHPQKTVEPHAPRMDILDAVGKYLLLIARAGGKIMTIADVAETDGNRLPEYESQPRPFKRLMWLSLAACAAIILAIEYLDLDAKVALITRQDEASAIGFLLNSALFVCFWLVYFSSGWSETLRCQTLRTLLKSHSNMWAQEGKPEQVSYFREKARSTMTSQAIFIAITVFIMNALARDPLIVTPADALALDRLIAFSSLSAAAVAFTLLLVSTDAAETMFNTFKVREYVAVSSLYLTSARLKYYGFVLCFVAISLFTYTMYAMVASLTIVVLTLCGYPYWFNDISADQRYKHEKTLYRIFVLLANMTVFALAYVN